MTPRFWHGLAWGASLGLFTLAGMLLCAWWGFRLIVGGALWTL